VKIVAWNVNHRIREKAIPDQMIQAIVSLGPDVIVLTEIAKSNGHVFIGKEPGPLSDHAALSIEITLRES